MAQALSKALGDKPTFDGTGCTVGDLIMATVLHTDIVRRDARLAAYVDCIARPAFDAQINDFEAAG